MVRTSILAAIFLLSLKSWAALHINMFSSPIILIHLPGVTNSSAEHVFYILDSVNDFDVVIATGINGYNSCFTESGSATYYTEVDGHNNYEASAFACANSMSSDSDRWSIGSDLDHNFDGNGTKYLAFKAKSTGGFNYGWFKLNCSETGDTLTIYGYGYNDQVSPVPNILIGEGECVTGISQIEMPANFAKCANGSIELLYPEPLEIKMYDVQGKFIRAIHFEGGEASYNCSSLAHGMYFLEIETEGQRKSAKIVL